MSFKTPIGHFDKSHLFDIYVRTVEITEKIIVTVA